ncbi:hypothetical protein [Henriciella litoralis]|uniref:hypothetical protein n=1 Tax=Henriciella litoralis TaxID=568102 RepID=UPI0009FF6775|nr:hypothetical protein [Henriciella litoralis]
MQPDSLSTGRLRVLAACASVAMMAACGQTNAESPDPQAASNGPATNSCAIPFPTEIPVPDKLTIESCTPSEKITGFHGKAPLPGNVDTVFEALKADYAANGYSFYDNSNGKIRSGIFGGKQHRKGEIQLNPKDGYLSVSINIYPPDMEE